MARTNGASFLNILLQLLSIGVSVAITVIVAEKLWVSVYDWRTDTFGTAVNSFFDAFSLGGGNTCLMTDWSQGANLCSYAWVVCAVSWVINIVLLIAQCFKSSRGCRVMEIFLGIFALLWWIAAAIVGTVYGTDADDADPEVPEKGYRTAVWALGWANVGLFALTLLLSAVGGAPKGKDQQTANGPHGAYTSVPPQAYATSNPTYVAQYPPPPGASAAQSPPPPPPNV